MDVYTIGVEYFAIQNWKNQILFIELNIVLNSVGMVWCLEFWVLVGLDSNECVPWRGYPRVSRNSSEPQHASFFETLE